MRDNLLEIYHRLLAHFGPRHWWPAKTPFEVIIGAILTQAVAWRNVERAIAGLETAGLLTPEALYHCPVGTTGNTDPHRYYRVKAKKSRRFSPISFKDHAGIWSACSNCPGSPPPGVAGGLRYW